MMVGPHSINREVDLLVPVDLIRNRIMEQWRVAQIVVNLALGFDVLWTR